MGIKGFCLQRLKDSLEIYQRKSQIIKPDVLKVVYHWPQSVAGNPSEKFSVACPPRQNGFLPHGLWAHEIVPPPPQFQFRNMTPWLERYQKIPRKQLLEPTFCDEDCPFLFGDNEAQALDWWPNLKDATNLVEAKGFIYQQWLSHGLETGLTPYAYYGIPLHLLMNLPSDMGITMDVPMKAEDMLACVRNTLDKNKARLGIDGVFGIDSLDAELNFVWNRQQTIRHLKEVRFWADGSFAQTINVPKRLKYTGLYTNSSHMAMLPSFYPSTPRTITTPHSPPRTTATPPSPPRTTATPPSPPRTTSTPASLPPTTTT